MTRTPVRGLALLATSGLLALSAAPATAATPVAQAEATALTLTIASTPTDSGAFSSTHDGDDESTAGSNQPAISAATGQRFIQVGTLAQDARTSVKNRLGYAEACSGLAGDGAVVAGVGEGGCLTPGQNVRLDAGTVDLSGLRIVKAEFLAGLDQALQDALAPVLDQLLPALSDGLEQALTGLGDLGVFLDAGVIQSQCTAGPGTSAGDAQIVDAAAYVEVGGTRVDLVALPVNPAPNTKVVTDLGVVVQEVLDAVRTELETAIDGALGPLTAVVDGAEVLAEALGQVGEQLAPLEDNVLDITLNKQTQIAKDEIEVTALDLAVLPAAQEFDVELLSAAIGTSHCGPTGKVGTPDPEPTPDPTKPPAPVPTSVPAGVETAAAPGDGMGLAGNLSLGALLALAGAAGVASWRRSLRG
ncbi:hypothetical protein I601_1456 [Nocardioides dokdonensis FR1436]|uniref:Gram-positive cocci surface proteins LPxTG domain-containing protein n=1 Tax=Nocardioides dokdonensis FR1436 TaxID=1300347 RepID=A0A1A9GJP8_9ACTN|nr:hypothetical protein [Nocardioides dokdonensis]ANH37892.1 hypothetical protein I601_1456 [Nocardioides dokdonensis FR1436]